MDRETFLKSADLGAGRLRNEGRALGRGAPATRSASMAGSADLVERALAILDESTGPKGPELAPRRLEVATRPLAPNSAVPHPAAPGALLPKPELELQRRVLSDGTECRLPIRYFDVQCLIATYLTGPDRAAELLGGSGLQAVLQEDGKAVVQLYCIEYRKTDIGPYNEVGLTVLAQAPGDPVPANFVVDLPVTTAEANRAGREIWGYNKFVASIKVEKRGKAFSTVLCDAQNGLIGAFEGVRGPSVPAPPEDILTFTIHQGRLVKTVIRVLTPFEASRGDGFAFKIGTSSHPMTSHLRTAEIDGAQPVLVHYADPFQSLLFPGRTL
jgi:hypothetical protein